MNQIFTKKPCEYANVNKTICLPCSTSKLISEVTTTKQIWCFTDFAANDRGFAGPGNFNNQRGGANFNNFGKRSASENFRNNPRGGGPPRYLLSKLDHVTEIHVCLDWRELKVSSIPSILKNFHL